jgi:peptidyl-prolyl cis-trans isomerase SurA
LIHRAKIVLWDYYLAAFSVVLFEAVSLIEKLMTQVSLRANLLTVNNVTAAFCQLLIAVGLICSMSVQPARAAGEVLGIAAIVNDAVISKYDLDQRVRLVVATSGLQPTRENIERIREQVLRSLVDEKLQMQEAERLELPVEDEQVDESITGIAQRAGMTSEEIIKYLDENGVNEAALRTQITADVAWNRVISARFAPLVQIGEDEIDETLARINSDASQVQFQLGEIYLSFDNPNQEREMAQGAQRLVEQLRAGAPFPNVAQQFSQAASAASGGDIGWVSESQLAPQISEAVSRMDVGTVSNPIRSLNGFYIMQLRSKRQGLGPNPLETRFQVMQVIFPLAPDAPERALQARVTQANKFRSEFRTCSSAPAQINAYPGARISQPSNLTAAQLRNPMRDQLLKTEAGTVVPIGRTERGVEALIVCDRKDDVGNQPTRDSIENTLFNQEVSMMARRHLRDLRRDAVIEYR